MGKGNCVSRTINNPPPLRSIFIPPPSGRGQGRAYKTESPNLHQYPKRFHHFGLHQMKQKCATSANHRTPCPIKVQAQSDCITLDYSIKAEVVPTSATTALRANSSRHISPSMSAETDITGERCRQNTARVCRGCSSATIAADEYPHAPEAHHRPLVGAPHRRTATPYLSASAIPKQGRARPSERPKQAETPHLQGQPSPNKAEGNHRKGRNKPRR